MPPGCDIIHGSLVFSIIEFLCFYPSPLSYEPGTRLLRPSSRANICPCFGNIQALIYGVSLKIAGGGNGDDNVAIASFQIIR